MKKNIMILMAIVALTMTAKAQWSLQTNPLGFGTSAMVGKVQFISATEGWIDASHSGSLLHTTDAGTTWNIVTPFPGDSVGNMSDPATTMNWTNSSHGWALKTYIVGTGDITRSGNGAVLYNTTNGGSSWAKKEFPKTITTITYSTADLQGTWQLHEIVAKNPSSSSTNQAAWTHGSITLDANGSGTLTNQVSNGQSQSDVSGLTLSISTVGLLTVKGSDMQGFMSTDKSTMIITSTENGGGYGLLVLQRHVSGTTYSTADLQGNWQMHGLSVGNGTGTRAGWVHATWIGDASGNFTGNFVGVGGSESLKTSVSISSSGIISGMSSIGSDVHGFMSADKNTFYVTATGSNGYFNLVAFQKQVTSISYSLSDLQGNWQLHSIVADNTNDTEAWASWTHAKVTMDASGNGTLSDFVVNNESRSEQDVSISISADGILSGFGSDDSNGFMSTDKSLVVLTTTDAGSGGYTFGIMQKDLTISGDIGLQVQFVDNSNGWASNYNKIYSKFVLYKTTDGGSTWNPTNSNAGGLYQFMDANNGWMIGTTMNNIGQDKPDNIFHTTDGGTTWTLQAENIGGACALYFTDLLHGWVVGGKGLILKTTDGGANWAPITNAGLSSASTSKCVFFLDADTGWIGTHNDGENEPNVLATKDGGATWETQQTPVTNSIFSISFWNTTNGWFTGDYGQIAHYTYIPPKTVSTTAGGLSSALTTTEKATLTNLIITGTLDARDFKTMRDDMPLLAEIDLSGATVTAYTGSEGTFYDATVTTYPANTIPQRAFYYTATKTGKASLKSFIFPASVTAIGMYAFRSSGLTSITIPSTVTSIDYGNFYNCSKLSSVIIPSSILSIGDYAFLYCKSLSSVNIPSTVERIGYAAFGYCGLNNIFIPEGVITIGDYAFQNCESLNSVSIPSTVTHNGYCAFTFDDALESIDVSAQNPYYSSVDGVLYNKSQQNLLCFPGGKETDFEIPSTVLVIDTAAFEGANNIQRVTIPSSVTKLSVEAFYWCQNLKTIDIPASVTSIGAYAFYNCSGLTSITTHRDAVDLSASDSVFNYVDKNNCLLYVPVGLKITYQEADQWGDFHNIVEQSSLNVIKTVYTSAGNLYSALTSTELKTTTDLTISGTLDARDFRIMRDSMPSLINLNIKEVSIVDYTGTEGTSGSTSIKYWGDNLPPNAFQNPVTYVGKQTLKSIILPSYLWAIGGAAFANSTLEKVVMPTTVYEIQSWSFSGSQIDSMYIPASVTTIGSSAFGGTNKLPSIDVSANNQYFTSVDGVLFDKSVTKLLAFPSAKCQSYTIPTGVTSIEANAFQASDYLQELTIPSTVTKIGNSAFIWSWGLKKIIIPASVTTIEANAFNSCENLSKIYVGSSTPLDLSSSADVFLNVDKTSCILYVPVGSKAAYQAAGQWKDFQNIVETGGSVTYNVTVPVGTKACYIAGEMNNWIQQIMTKVDDTNYTITIQNADISQKYKYCSGPSWDYQEMDINGNYISDRSYSEKDVVASWLVIFDPSTVTASDYYLPLKVGNHTELYTTYPPVNEGWSHRTTTYSYIRTDEINGIPYYLEEGWEGNFSNCSDCTEGPFRYMWIRKDAAGNLLLGAYAVEDYGGMLTDDISKAYVLPEPLPWFPNTFLNVGGYTAFAVEDTVMSIDSVISITATAGSYTNCIQLRNIERSLSGIVTFIEDSYYAYHVGLVMQNRLFPVEDIHTNYITDYLADSPTDIKEINSSENSFTLYPNPATDGFYINTGEKVATVSIYNLGGTIIQTKQLTTGNEFINVSNLSHGVYMVKILTNNGLAVKKLIKK